LAWKPQTARSNTTCNHGIAPWGTDENRQQIANAIAYAREDGDVEALPLLLAWLTQPCDARDAYHVQKGDRS
jgi:hypothetical protein